MKFSKQLVLAAILSFAVSGMAQAADWPLRTVRWIVPFAAGGTGDAAARSIAQKLTERWGQQVVIDNKPGAYTVIGAVEATRARPDGYTLFQPLNSTLTINPHAFTKLPYDPVKDFTPIAMFASVPLIIVANDASPAKSIDELVAHARKEPGKLPMGGTGIGVQLGVERFARDANIQLQYVSYKSGADVMKGLLSSEIPTGLDGIPAYPPFLKSGKLRALAVNTGTRVAALPEVPTLAELGFKNSEVPHWHGLAGPANLPSDIRQKIAADLQAVLALPELRDRLRALGLEPKYVEGNDFVKLIADERAMMGPLIKELGIKLD